MNFRGVLKQIFYCENIKITYKIYPKEYLWIAVKDHFICDPNISFLKPSLTKRRRMFDTLVFDQLKTGT